MGKWIATVEIMDLFAKYDETLEHALKISKEVAERLNNSEIFNGTKFAERLLACEDADAMDVVLKDLYDYCDDKRIWLGIM